MTSIQPQYIIPQLKQAYNRKHYPVGSPIILRICSMVVAKKYGLQQMVSEGTILRYVSFDYTDNAYDEIEIQWRYASTKPFTNVMMLQNIILLKDKETYQQQDSIHRAIKHAMLEVGVSFQTSSNTWEEWAELNMDMSRKLALIKAGVAVENVNLYNNLNIEELQSLKHHIRAMEGKS